MSASLTPLPKNFLPGGWQSALCPQDFQGGVPLASQVAQWACAALMEEVSASPKPGLVCPGHNGSHADMDFATFQASAESLRSYFHECVRLGSSTCYKPHTEGMPLLRQAGILAEQAMFAATGGVNTHKGMVFSLGLLTAAYGRLSAIGAKVDPHTVSAEAAHYITGLVERELAPLQRQVPARRLTAGEQLYLLYGVSGIRGEAETGFPSALAAFSVLGRTLAVCSFEAAMPHTLLHLMATTPDTNVLWRGGAEGLAYVQSAARNALHLGGMLRPEGRAAMLVMHKEFPLRNLSPGGSADLLAIAAFFRAISG